MASEPNDKPNADDPTTTGLKAPWLRRADQTGVALLVVLGLAGTFTWWWSHGGPQGELIEFENLEPQWAEFRVDVNSAEWPELAPLPDIGETLARRIVESREHEGLYTNHDDLRRVKGIGPRKLEKIRPYLLPISKQNSYCESGVDDSNTSGQGGV